MQCNGNHCRWFYVVAWNCVGDACWVYRISVGIWIYFGLAWLAGVIGSMQENLEGLISKANPKSKVKSRRGIHVGNRMYAMFTCILRGICVAPVGNE